MQHSQQSEASSHKDQEDLQAEAKAFLALESSAKEHSKALESAKQRTGKARTEQEDAESIIQKVRRLDQKLAEQRSTVAKEEKICKADAEDIDADKQDRLQKQKKRKKAEDNLKTADSYLKVHERDEQLISGLSAIAEQLDRLFSKQEEVRRTADECLKSDKDLERSIKELGNNVKQCSDHERELEKASQKLRTGEDALRTLLGGRLLREYHTDKEVLFREMGFHSKTKIAELKDHRTELEDGKPCPLCGALEHPFAEGNIPVPDETEKKMEGLKELIKKAENLEDNNRKVKEAEDDARKSQTESARRKEVAANDKKAAEDSLEGLQHDLRQLRADCAELKQAAYARLQPLGVADTFPITASHRCCSHSRHV